MHANQKRDGRENGAVIDDGTGAGSRQDPGTSSSGLDERARENKFLPGRAQVAHVVLPSFSSSSSSGRQMNATVRAVVAYLRRTSVAIVLVGTCLLSVVGGLLV